MNLQSLIVFTVGGVLVYAAIKGYNPIDVFKNAVGGKPPEVVFQNSSYTANGADGQGDRNPWGRVVPAVYPTV